MNERIEEKKLVNDMYSDNDELEKKCVTGMQLANFTVCRYVPLFKCSVFHQTFRADYDDLCLVSDPSFSSFSVIILHESYQICSNIPAKQS